MLHVRLDGPRGLAGWAGPADVRHFQPADPSCPALYDLVIDSTRLAPAAWADMIVTAALAVAEGPRVMTCRGRILTP